MNEKDKKLINTQTQAQPAAEQTPVSKPTQTSVSTPQTGVKPQVGAYVPSDNVKAAQAAIAAQKKPVPYTSKWGAQIDDALSKILNREEFSYDVNADKLFDQYKDSAVRTGKLAMEDTVAKMSSMTGGYGNSWAQTAGQAAYAKEMSKVNDIIPELEALAFERYRAEGDALRDKYGLLLDAEDTDYGRHRDEMSDYLTERDYLRGIYDDERSFDYGVWSNQQDREYREKTDAMENMWRNIDRNDKLARYDIEDARYDTEWQHQLDREEIEDGRYADETAYNRKMDARDYALSLIKSQSGGQSPVEDIPMDEPEYFPFGNMGEDAFYKSMADVYYSYNDPDNEGRGIEAAVALVKRVGATDEAKAAFGDYFGEELMNKYFPEAVAEKIQGYDVDYSSWSAGEWEEYFAYIRQNESPEDAEKELNDLVKQGVIPQNMISYARKGASGTLGH